MHSYSRPSGFLLSAQLQVPLPLYRLNPGNSFSKLSDDGQNVTLPADQLKPQLQQLLAKLDPIGFKFFIRPLPHVLGGPFPLFVLFELHSMDSFSARFPAGLQTALAEAAYHSPAGTPAGLPPLARLPFQTGSGRVSRRRPKTPARPSLYPFAFQPVSW